MTDLLAEEINKLPERVRLYIHDLEARGDPAGDIASARLAEDQLNALAPKFMEAQAQLARIPKLEAENAELKEPFWWCFACKKEAPAYVLGNDPHQEIRCKVIKITRFPKEPTE